MKRKHLPLVALIVLVLATIIEGTLESLVGADVVFYGGLIALPIVLVWSASTKNKPIEDIGEINYKPYSDPE